MPIERLPKPLRPPARTFRDYVATDKGLILILAGLFLSRAVSYLVDPPGVLQHVLEFAPLWVATTIWWAGFALLALALLPNCERFENVALSVAVAILVLWWLLYAWAGAATFLGRGSAYLTVALLAIYTVWRGHSTTIRVRGDDGITKHRAGE